MREAAAAAPLRAGGVAAAPARRLGVILGRLGGVLEATHARPRLLLAPHPTERGGRRVLAGRGPACRLGTAAGRADASCRSGRRPRSGEAPAPASSARTSRPTRSTRCGSSRRISPRIPTLPQLALEPAPSPRGARAVRREAQRKGSSTTAPTTPSRRPRPSSRERPRAGRAPARSGRGRATGRRSRPGRPLVRRR